MLITLIRSPNCQTRLTKFFPLKATVEVVIGLVPSHTALEIRKMKYDGKVNDVCKGKPGLIIFEISRGSG